MNKKKTINSYLAKILIKLFHLSLKAVKVILLSLMLLISVSLMKKIAIMFR